MGNTHEHVLSVIIVSYNVRKFLNQCLVCLEKALDTVDAEIIVVDCNSSDNTPTFILKHFASIRLIPSDSNLGFSKACNLGVNHASGEYLLFLNPDTLVEEDSIKHILEFASDRPKCGLVGGQILNGSGRYLAESKRNLPSIGSGFRKILGLSNQGYYDQQDPDQNAQIEVISGAFAFISSKLFQKIGGFDEDYFMYGEDIDLSLKTLNAGAFNWYVPEARLIHFKGESTNKRGRVYNYHFYRSMRIYLFKNVLANTSQFSKFVYRIIFSLLSIFRSTFANLKSVIPTLVDWSIAVLVFYGVASGWAIWYHSNSEYFPVEVVRKCLPLYASILVLGFFISGYYFQRGRREHLIRGVVVAFFLSMTVYALIPEAWRFSRPVVLLWLSVSGLVFWLRDGISQKIRFNQSVMDSTWYYTTGPGHSSELAYLRGLFLGNSKIGTLNSQEPTFETIRTDHSTHIVFDIRSVLLSDCINLMQLKPTWTFGFFDPINYVYTSSQDDKTRGEAMDRVSSYNLAKPEYRLHKRIFDVIGSLFFGIVGIVLSPFGRPRSYFTKILQIIIGKLTFVSYSSIAEDVELPRIKPGLLSPADRSQINEAYFNKIINEYALHYSIFKDFLIVFGNLNSTLKALNHKDD